VEERQEGGGLCVRSLQLSPRGNQGSEITRSWEKMKGSAKKGGEEDEGMQKEEAEECGEEKSNDEGEREKKDDERIGYREKGDEGRLEERSNRKGKEDAGSTTVQKDNQPVLDFSEGSGIGVRSLETDFRKKGERKEVTKGKKGKKEKKGKKGKKGKEKDVKEEGRTTSNAASQKAVAEKSDKAGEGRREGEGGKEQMVSSAVDGHAEVTPAESDPNRRMDPHVQPRAHPRDSKEEQSALEAGDGKKGYLFSSQSVANFRAPEKDASRARNTALHRPMSTIGPGAAHIAAQSDFKNLVGDALSKVGSIASEETHTVGNRVYLLR
tara:strand:+ start:212 stop:1183 length:972 start_codon:yes stop_codon:yes gene_type:complete